MESFLLKHKALIQLYKRNTKIKLIANLVIYLSFIKVYDHSSAYNSFNINDHLHQSLSSSSSSSLLPNLFMQDPKSSQTRKPWYQKAIGMATLWKSVTKPPENSNGTLRKTIFKTGGNNNNNNIANITTCSSSNRNKLLRKCSSMRVAASFTRVCLCAPISSYTEVFQVDHRHLNNPPRRSYTYPRSSSNSFSSKSSQEHHHNHHIISNSLMSSGRMSLDGTRKVFRGKSLTEDVLMRRFVVEEEAMMQELKRKNEMDIIRRRISGLRKKKKIGPSPLSRMSLAEDEEKL